MKYCPKCGAEADENAVYCKFCGTKIDAEPLDEDSISAPDEKSAPVFDGFSGDKQSSVSDAPNEPPLSDTPAVSQSDAQQAEPLSYTQNDIINDPPEPKKVEADIDDKRHAVGGAIARITVMLCALAMILTMLFAPIKFVDNTWHYQSDDGEEVYSATVDQNIFKIIGALFYIKPDRDRLDEFGKEWTEIQVEVTNEFSEWESDHEDASDEEKDNKLIEMLTDRLSEWNYFGAYFTALAFRGQVEPNVYYIIYITYAFAFLSAIFAIDIVIRSIIAFIRSAVDLGKKRKSFSPDKYLLKMVKLSSVALGFSLAAPLLKAGGMMLGGVIAAISAIVICGIVGGILVDRKAATAVIARAVSAISLAVALCLLCGDILGLNDFPTFSSVIYNMPIGSGMYVLLHSMNEEYMSMGAFGPSVAVFLIYIAVVAIVYACIDKALNRSCARLLTGGGKPFMGKAVAICIFVAAAALLGAYASEIASGISKMYDSPAVWDIDCSIAVRVYVSAALALVAALVDKNAVAAPKTTLIDNT